VAPPGESLHRYGTELDLGPPEAYDWLARNAERFGFEQRYSWQPGLFEVPALHGKRGLLDQLDGDREAIVEPARH